MALFSSNRISSAGTIPVSPLPKLAAHRQLDRYLDICSRGTRFQAGGLLDMSAVPASTPIIYVGDLHERNDNLNRILDTGNNYDQLSSGRLVLNILGDAVHPDQGPMEMSPSVQIMQHIMDLKIMYPDNFYYHAGNHDSFSTKAIRNVNGYPVFPGLLMRLRLEELYGADYVEKFQNLIAALPIISVASGVITTHGGPIKSPFTMQQLAALSPANEDDPIVKQAIWGRYEYPKDPKLTYGMADVQHFLSAMDQGNATLLVAHTKPADGSWHREIAPNHHVIFGALDKCGFATLQYGKLRFEEASGASPSVHGRLPVEFYTKDPLPKRPKRTESDIIAGNVALFRQGDLHDRSTIAETICRIGDADVTTFAYAEPDGTLVAFGPERSLSPALSEMLGRGLLYKIELWESIFSRKPGKPRFCCTLPTRMPLNVQNVINQSIERANREHIANTNRDLILDHMRREPKPSKIREIPAIIANDGTIISITDVDGLDENLLDRMERGEISFIKLSVSRKHIFGGIVYGSPMKYASAIDGKAFAVIRMTVEALNKA